MAGTANTGGISTSGGRLTGYMSGLDIDKIVGEMTVGTQTKIDRTSQNRQLDVWRQEAYWEVTGALSEFYNKYFSSSGAFAIGSESFYDVAEIVSSSPYISVSGSTAARRMSVTGVTQLAKQAGFSSVHKASAQAAKSAAIPSQWRNQVISGASVELELGGSAYSVTVDPDINFYTADSPQKVVDALNKAVSKLDGLKGRLVFSLEDGAVTAASNDPSADLRITGGSEALLKGLGLAKSETAAQSVTGGPADTAYFFSNLLPAGSRLEFQIDGKTQVLTLGKSADLTADINGTFARKLQKALTEAIAGNSGLSGVSVQVTEQGDIAFASESGALQITGGSRHMLEGLGLDTPEGYQTAGTVSDGKLFSRHLDETLSGATLTFRLNGLSKSVTFLESERSAYASVEDLAAYLQTKLDGVYGKDRVTVRAEDGALTFKTGDGTSVFEVASCDAAGVLGKNGALRIYAGEANRLNVNKTLEALSENLSSALVPMDGSDTFGLTVNGRDFIFRQTDSLRHIVDTINNDQQANIEIAYSSTTDSFTVGAKNGGAASRVEISDLGGSNLASVLFGTAGEADEHGNLIAGSGDYVVTMGQDAILSVSFNGDPESAVQITRSENQFTLDGVQFTLHRETDPAQINADSPITFQVKENTGALYDKLKSFVDDYNAIIKLVTDKLAEKKETNEKYLPLTNAQKKEMSETQITEWEKNAKKGLLQGDLLLNSLVSEFRRSMTDLVESVRGGLYQYGISTQANDYKSNGRLVVDEKALKEAISGGANQIRALFTGTDGIAARMKDVIQKNIGANGTDGLLVLKAGKREGFTLTKSALAQSIETYDKRLKTLNIKLADEESRYYAQFARLETYLSTMNMQAGLFIQNNE